MTTVTHELAAVLEFPPNKVSFDEKRLLAMGDIVGASDKIVVRMRSEQKLRLFAFVLTFVGSIVGPIFASWLGPINVIPTLTMVVAAVPPLCTLYLWLEHRNRLQQLEMMTRLLSDET